MNTSRHDSGGDARKAITGSIWTIAGYGGSQVLRLASNLILARLLLPDAFGLMALVAVFMQGLQMFSDIGIGPSIIQNKAGENPEFLRTAWTIQVIRGLALGLLTALLAYPVARFFAANDPSALRLARILPVVAINPVMAGFTSTGLYTLNRRLRIGRVTLLELIPQTIALLIMVAWALQWPSVWALVAGGIGSSLARLALSHAWNQGPPDRFGWQGEAVGELIRFGRWIFLSTVIACLASHLDRILLGRLLTLTELGLYSIGMTFARVASHTASRLSAAVIFPLLAKRQDDPLQLVGACLRTRRSVLWGCGALCVAFGIFAPYFFDTLYREAYRGAGPISRWLVLYTWTYVLLTGMDRIPLAQGKPRTLFVANCINTLAMALAVLGYRLAALPGFIIGMSLSKIAAHLYIIARLPSGRLAMLRQSLIATVTGAAYMLAAIRIVDAYNHLHWLPRGMMVGTASALPCLAAAWYVWQDIQQWRQSR